MLLIKLRHLLRWYCALKIHTFINSQFYRPSFQIVFEIAVPCNCQNNTVISLACWGGMEELGDMFIACGARHYIGPTDAPHGSASLMYALDFLYNYIHVEQDVEKAHQAASGHGDDRGMFTLYKAGEESQ